MNSVCHETYESDPGAVHEIPQFFDGWKFRYFCWIPLFDDFISKTDEATESNYKLYNYVKYVALICTSYIPSA